ncbi:MAG: dTDP-4-dehydrorhamnose reductase [Lentisphaerae bacterium]|nr:dTDP-4-dehydrorhamnose reductase [Lentisphaerota bacterium]
MLGADLAGHLRCRGLSVRTWDLPEWDITRPDHLARALEDATAVVNCAAFTRVDQAEAEPDLAMAVNAEAVGQLGQLALAKGLFVVHISTDFVFDGRGRNPYRETDAPAPLSVYGLSKHRGELALQESGCAHAILRVEWSYGRQGANFISKFLDKARGAGELKVVVDQFGAPTWTADSARAIRLLLEGRHTGLYHFANAGYASRYEVATFIAQRLRLRNKILPCRSAEFPLPAARPANSRFDTTKIQSLLERPIRAWQTALAEYLALL